MPEPQRRHLLFHRLKDLYCLSVPRVAQGEDQVSTDRSKKRIKLERLSDSVRLFIALLILSVVLASLHMLAPDHWAPLTTLSDRHNYSASRTAATAGALGFFHGVTSAVVAMTAAFVGIYLVHSFIQYLKIASISILCAVGIYFLLEGRRESEAAALDGTRKDFAVLAVSVLPDLSFLPILLTGAALGTQDLTTIVGAFIAASCISLVLVVHSARKGLSIALSRISPRFYDYAIAAMLFGTAIFLLYH